MNIEDRGMLLAPLCNLNYLCTVLVNMQIFPLYTSNFGEHWNNEDKLNSSLHVLRFEMKRKKNVATEMSLNKASFSEY